MLWNFEIFFSFFFKIARKTPLYSMGDVTAFVKITVDLNITIFILYQFSKPFYPQNSWK